MGFREWKNINVKDAILKRLERVSWSRKIRPRLLFRKARF